MLPQINNSRKEKQPKARDENVRNEIDFLNRNDIQPMGNEAANIQLKENYINMPGEANEDNMSDLSYAEPEEVPIPDEVKKGSKKFSRGNIINNKPDRIEKLLDESDSSIDLNNSMYLNSSHNIVNENTLERLNNKQKNKPKKGKKKPDREEIKDAFEIAEEIVKDQPQLKNPDTYAQDEDMAVHTGKKIKKSDDKGLKNRGIVENADEMADEYWKSAARERIKKVEMRDPNEQVRFQAEEMEKLKNWNFQPVKMGEIKKTTKWRKALSYLAGGMGKLFRIALQILSFGYLLRGKSMLRFGGKKTNEWQRKKDYQTIPGWDGATYDPNATSGKDIMADFRRVPTVWSRLTAAKAADEVVKDGKKTEKPLDPVVSVMIDQPETNSSASMVSDRVGHAFLGIEYSRKSIISGRYERYKLKYGFYPANGVDGLTSSNLLSMKQNLTLPGQLNDDEDHKYDVSRRYPASPEQVSEIFKASEKYAEGGYNIYDRNCVSFVKDMVVNTAHLETGGEIFKQSDIRYSSYANLGLFMGEAFKQNAITGMENTLMDISEQEDETYQNYGNKQATARDWANYKNSMKGSSSIIKQTISPAETAERLRRMEGEGTGEIGSYKFNEPLKDENGTAVLGLGWISKAIQDYGIDLQDDFNSIIPPNQQGKLPYEMLNISDSFPLMATPLKDLELKVDKYVDEYNEDEKHQTKLKAGEVNAAIALKPEDLREAREELSKNISDLSILQMYYLKNDKRMHNQIMNLISLLNYGVRYVDDLYEQSIRGGEKHDEVTNIRENVTHSVITVKAGEATEEFTPTHYESYIQIYKTPEKAVAAYARYKELKEKKQQSEDWTEDKLSVLSHQIQSKLGLEDPEEFTFAESKEFEKLQRLEDLAIEFDHSHRYMTEKDKYSQQDIDYAFRLQDKEVKGLDMRDQETSNTVNQYKTAGGIYITMFMDQIFKDLKESFMKSADEGGGPDEPAANLEAVKAWFDKYLTERANQKKTEFNKIVIGIFRSVKSAGPAGKEVTEEDVLEKLVDVITNTCIDKNFSGGSYEIKSGQGLMSLAISIQNILDNKGSQFTKLVRSMIKQCQNEEMEQMHLY